MSSEISLPGATSTTPDLFSGDCFSAIPSLRQRKRNRAVTSYDSLMFLFSEAIRGAATTLEQKTWKKDFAQLDFEKALEVTNSLFENPGVASRFEIGKAMRLSIKPWGGSKHSFAEFPLILMKIIATEEDRIPLFQDELSQKIHRLFQETHFETKKLSSLPDLEFKALGRTLVTPDPDVPGFQLAYKFKRIDEKMDDFCREAAMTELFKQSELFLSTLPEPLGVYSLKGIDKKIVKLLPKDVDAQSPFVYIQRTRPSYYKYLHEIEDENEWKEARKKFLIDSGLQIRCGQMPPFVELYHNEETRRRYQPLINLVGGYDRGAGRVETPFEKARYPNAGADGIRDVGDGDLIDDLIKMPFRESPDLFKFKEGKMPYMLMNAVAKLSFVDTIMLASRLEKFGKINWEDPAIISKTAKDLKKGQEWILQGFLGCSEGSADTFVEALPIDWEKQAKQLLFWLQIDEKGYPKYLREGFLPRGLYDDDMQVDLNLENAENYHNNGTFASNGGKDIGCYNGPLGFVEHEKGWYFISAIAVGKYLYQSLRDSS